MALSKGRAQMNSYDDAHLEDGFDFPDDEPPLIVAVFNGKCSTCGDRISIGDTIRANGHGGWECQDCIADDQPYVPTNLINELFGPKSGHGEWWKE